MAAVWIVDIKHMIISVKNLQAFNMAAVLTDKNKQTNKKHQKKKKNDDFSQLSTSFQYGCRID